ncbi:ABC transporter ATP-binding protein [Thiohalomonas denitrificans]|uniref:ABC-2 type transport system ATP-binding protein n=1 Tax=Thiohalomonas denitrificans TaxID=415747 RepID=A0A1G5PVI3_9GAMM|nr:ATP-binding cassette domain-containing protein [Thiohalomonas denitrificans]SCZ53221.1 ABC-2 type transport system ATP-binding protein [Thiohalomonas denitrificans]
MSEASLIGVEHLYRYFGTHCAVNGISFEVRRGEVLGFLGPNGAGKSTTMRMLTGNLAPSAGRITVGGIDLLEHPKRAKAAIGYLPEQPPLYRELTVNEYLTYCARLHRIERARIPAALAAAKERCGLTESGDRLIGNLSKGYQQRVGIAQAIIHSPDVVVLDEPTVGLDPIQIREIRALIRELGGEHSVILSTHILPEVQATCDRVQIIHQGELVVSDTIAGLEQRMQTSRLTIGLHRPPDIDTLRAIEGVRSVEAEGTDRFHIGHYPAESPAEALALAAARENWGLYELIPERRSLEDVFVDLTTSESGREAA